MKNGVPYETAFGMDDAERLAHCIIFGQMDGGEYDWNRMRWKERS